MRQLFVSTSISSNVNKRCPSEALSELAYMTAHAVQARRMSACCQGNSPRVMRRTRTARLTLPGRERVAQDDRVEGAQPLLRRVLPEGGLAAPQHPPLLVPLQADHLWRTPAAVVAWVAAGAVMQSQCLQTTVVDDRDGYAAKQMQ